MDESLVRVASAELVEELTLQIKALHEKEITYYLNGEGDLAEQADKEADALGMQLCATVKILKGQEDQVAEIVEEAVAEIVEEVRVAQDEVKEIVAEAVTQVQEAQAVTPEAQEAPEAKEEAKA